MSAAAAKPRESGPFSLKVVLALIAVGVFSFSAFLTLSTFEPDLNSGADGRAHALSRSATGFAAAVQLARARGDVVSVARTPPREILSRTFVVMAPEYELTADEIAELTGEDALIILPKWATLPDPTHRGWVQRIETVPEEAIDHVLFEVAPKVEVNRTPGRTRPHLDFRNKFGPNFGVDRLEAGGIDQLQTISSPLLTPLITAPDGGAILAYRRLDDGTDIYVLADPDFLNTHGIAQLANARVGMTILDGLHDEDEPIVFDVTLNGFSSSNGLLKVALTPPFLGATLCLLAVAFLLGWRSFARGGPNAKTQRQIALGKKALAENSAALIRLAHREHRMGGRYAALTRAKVAELIGAARQEDADAIAQLDRLSVAQGMKQTFSELAAEAAGAKTRAQLLAAARKLHEWNEEMIRAAG